MTPLDDLVQRFPCIFRGTPPPGSDLEPGWLGIADDFCCALPRLLDEQHADLQVEQIKEKFGELRIYVRVDSDDVALKAAIGALRQACGARSLMTCAACGQPGKRRTDRSYIQTLCDAHAAARNARTKEDRP